MRIKDTPKVDQPKTILRQCVICSKDIVVKVFSDGNYIGGNYFGAISAEKYKRAEYWECDECYNNEGE